MNKNDINIESYDEQDAFYTGTDEEYQDFLKNADIEINEGEPVERTQKINLNETINIQSVIERFKKTAGGIKDTVVSKVDGLRSKKEAPAQNAPKPAEEMQEEQRNTESAVSEINIDKLCEMADELSKKLDELSAKESHRMCDHERNYSDIKRSVNEISTNVADVKQITGSITKLNDSMFDLKNTQLNTKKVISDLITSFTRLKKKCVLGVTVLSILSAIIIVLQIVLMLS